MTDQLHDVLGRIAEQAGPGLYDPSVWTRARRAKRRDGLALASAIAVAVIALVAVSALVVPDLRSSPPSVEQDHAAIPNVIHAVKGDGDLPLEADLSVGQAAVAFANGEDAFVVLASDGSYHRLQLPGFEPERYDAAHPGLALSPDGTKLVYTAHQRDRQFNPEFGPIALPSVVDLVTGEARTVPVWAAEVAEDGGTIAAYGYRWSSDSRTLVYEVWAPVTWGHPLHCCGHGFASVDTASGASIYVTSRWTLDDPTVDGAKLPTGSLVISPVAVSPDHLVARVVGSELSIWGGDPISAGGYSQRRANPVPTGQSWATGAYSTQGRLVLQPELVGSALYVVDRGPGQAGLLPLDSAMWPQGATIDVLGWVGEDRALALVHRATGPDEWEQDGDLVLLGVDASVERTAVVSHVTGGDSETTFSFATDLAGAASPADDVG